MRLEMLFSEGKLKGGPYILCGDNILGVQWFHFWLFGRIIRILSKEIFWTMFKGFFIDASFEKSLNTTSLMLVPKKRVAQEFKDF